MRLLLSMLVVGSGLLACKKEATNKVAATIGRPFDLPEQQTATLPAGGGNTLSIRLAKVQDSRCPIGVQCITAGYVTVDVDLTDATATPQTAHIILGPILLPGYAPDSASVVLNQQKYWLRLLDVKPYPSLASSPTKVATLRLRPY